MLKRVTVVVRGWVAPAAVGKTVLIEGSVLFVKCDKYYTRSLSLYAMRVLVPGEYSYGVEYRLAEGGEFRVTTGKHGGIMARSRYARGYAIPVCWMPESFLGKDVDRYIVRIDDKRVNIKSGVKECLRGHGSGAPPARRAVPVRTVA